MDRASSGDRSSVHLANVIPQLIGYRRQRADYVCPWTRNRSSFSRADKRPQATWPARLGITIRLCFIDRRRRIIRPDEFDYGFWRCRGDGWRGNKHCRSFNNSQWVSSEGHRCYSASQGFHFARGIRKSTAPHQRIDFTDRSIDRSLILCWFDLSGIDVLAWCEEV